MAFYDKYGKCLMLENNLTSKDEIQPFLDYNEGKIYLSANMEEHDGKLLGFVRLTARKQKESSMFYQKDVTKELSYKTIKTVQNHLKPYFDEIDNYIFEINKKVESHSDDTNGIYGVFGFEYLPLIEIRKTIKGTDKILKMIDGILKPLVLKMIANNGGLEIKEDTKKYKTLLLKEIGYYFSHNDNSIVDEFVINLRIKLIEEFQDEYNFEMHSEQKLKKIIINQLIQQRKTFLRLIAIQYSLTASVEEKEENNKKLASTLVSRRIIQKAKQSRYEVLKIDYPTEREGQIIDEIFSHKSFSLSDELSKNHEKLLLYVDIKNNQEVGSYSNSRLVKFIDNPEKVFTESFKYCDKEFLAKNVPIEIFTKEHELLKSLDAFTIVEIKLLKVNDSLKDELNKTVISHFNESKQKLDELINNVYLKHATKFNLLNFMSNYDLAHLRTELTERNAQDYFLD